MSEAAYKTLMRIAVLLTLAWVGWTFYDTHTDNSNPESMELAAAVKNLEDGNLEDALTAYGKVLGTHPDNLGALRGKAQTLMQFGNRYAKNSHLAQARGNQSEADKLVTSAADYYRRSLLDYDDAIRRQDAMEVSAEHLSIQGVAYANRGILKDRMGDYQGALSDYRMAMKLEPRVTEGPGFFTRFMRNQTDTPPTVLDRARYLEEQLAKSGSEQLLQISEEDARQRPYKLD